MDVKRRMWIYKDNKPLIMGDAVGHWLRFKLIIGDDKLEMRWNPLTKARLK